MSNHFGAEYETAWTRKLSELMDEMLKRSFVEFRHSKTWQPATNVYESEDAFWVCMELAGVRRDQIDVECHDRRLTVRGVRSQPRPAGSDEALSMHVVEIDEGAFQRVVELPAPLDIEAVSATYTEGFLWIQLPKTQTS